MHTLRLFASRQLQVPASTAWYLSDLGEFRGKQELYTRQSPQRLKVLREHALIESAVSSTVLKAWRWKHRAFARCWLHLSRYVRDRDEGSARLSRCVAWIHGQADDIGVTEATIKQLHATARGRIWDTGRYKERWRHHRRYPTVAAQRFKTVPATAHATCPRWYRMESIGGGGRPR